MEVTVAAVYEAAEATVKAVVAVVVEAEAAAKEVVTVQLQ